MENAVDEIDVGEGIDVVVSCGPNIVFGLKPYINMMF